MQEPPHTDAVPNVHTNAKYKLRRLLLTLPFAEGSNHGPFATLSTIQPLSHMGPSMVECDNHIKRVSYLQYLDEKQPQKGKESRLCSDNLIY
jgi:hypothetical protein